MYVLIHLGSIVRRQSLGKCVALTLGLHLEIHHNGVAKHLDQPADVAIQGEVLQPLLVRDWYGLSESFYVLVHAYRVIVGLK